MTPLDSDVVTAHSIAARSLSREQRGTALEVEAPVPGRGMLPRGLARQHDWATRVLEQLDGDIDRLLATGQECRRRVGDGKRTADSRVAYVRATDLCEQAVAMISARSGTETPDRALMGRYMAGVAEPDDTLRVRVMSPLFLPNPVLDDYACMRVLSRRERLRAQLRPKGPADCCQYHAGDWRTASCLAIGILRVVRRCGLPDGAATEVVEPFTKGMGLAKHTLDAVECLLLPGVAIELVTVEGQVLQWEGRHRTHAMLRAGVKRTVVSVE